MKRILLALVVFVCLTVSAEAVSRFAVCSVTCTWDGSSTAMWSASSGGATGASVPGASDTVTLDANTCVGGVTCTITVNTNFNISSLTMGACTASTSGCVLDLSANNNSPTMGSLSVTGTGTRTLNCGTGTFTLTTNNNTVVDFTTTTNLTLSCASAAFVFSQASPAGIRTFITGGKTFGAVSVSGTTVPTYPFTFSTTGNPTFTSLTLQAGIIYNFTGATTLTLNTTPTWAGNSGALITAQVSSISVTQVTIAIPAGTAPTLSWMAFYGVVFTGNTSGTATSSFDLGRNSGIAISGPSAGGGRIIGG